MCGKRHKLDIRAQTVRKRAHPEAGPTVGLTPRRRAGEARRGPASTEVGRQSLEALCWLAEGRQHA